MMYVNHIIMLYTLNLYSAVCQSYLNKTGRKKKGLVQEFQRWLSWNKLITAYLSPWLQQKKLWAEYKEWLCLLWKVNDADEMGGKSNLKKKGEAMTLLIFTLPSLSPGFHLRTQVEMNNKP